MLLKYIYIYRKIRDETDSLDEEEKIHFVIWSNTERNAKYDFHILRTCLGKL